VIKGNRKIYLRSTATLVIGVLIILGILVQTTKIVRFGSVIAMSLIAVMELAILSLLIMVFVKAVFPKKEDSGRINNFLRNMNALPEEKSGFKNYKNKESFY